jgi:hypothetical protein
VLGDGAGTFKLTTAERHTCPLFRLKGKENKVGRVLSRIFVTRATVDSVISFRAGHCTLSGATMCLERVRNSRQLANVAAVV